MNLLLTIIAALVLGASSASSAQDTNFKVTKSQDKINVEVTEAIIVGDSHVKHSDETQGLYKT